MKPEKPWWRTLDGQPEWLRRSKDLPTAAWGLASVVLLLVVVVLFVAPDEGRTVAGALFGSCLGMWLGSARNDRRRR